MIVKVRTSDAVVVENFFDHRRRYAFLAPHHTHHTIFFGLILVAECIRDGEA
jgi:hypothetical protein